MRKAVQLLQSLRLLRTGRSLDLAHGAARAIGLQSVGAVRVVVL
jgi:hypothetical protein